MVTFRFDLVSPAELLFTNEVDQVDLPGMEGDFGVLASHVPIVALLRPGIITVRTGGSTERFVLMGGFAEFSGSELTVLADAPSPGDDSTRLASRSGSTSCSKAWDGFPQARSSTAPSSCWTITNRCMSP